MTIRNRRPHKDQDVHKYNRKRERVVYDAYRLFLAAGVNAFDPSENGRVFFAKPVDPHILVGNVKVFDLGNCMVNLQFFSPAGTESINVGYDVAIWFLTNNYHPQEATWHSILSNL